MPGTQGAHNNGRIFLSFQEKKEGAAKMYYFGIPGKASEI